MLDIVTLGDERLQKHSIVIPEFDGEIQSLTEEMFDTLYAHKGIGLAAVQVGKLIRLFITHVPNDDPRVFINPEVVETSVEQATYEEASAEIHEGYSLLVFSDGAIEVENSAGQMLGTDGLLGILRQQGCPETDLRMDALEEGLLKYSNAIRLEDDLTFVEVRLGRW